MRKAVRKASYCMPAPKKIAKTWSRTKPRTRLAITAILTMLALRATLGAVSRWSSSILGSNFKCLPRSTDSTEHHQCSADHGSCIQRQWRGAAQEWSHLPGATKIRNHINVHSLGLRDRQYSSYHTPARAT